MSPSELEEYARQQYNSVGDSFFTQAELFRHIFNAQMELSREAKCIRGVYTTTTTSGTQEYAFPSNAFSIKRVTYDGLVLRPIVFREDDVLTLSNSVTTTTGTPSYYFIWGRSIFLRDIPDSSVAVLKIYSYDKPRTVSAVTTLEVSEEYHHDIADYLLYRKALKDKDAATAAAYKANWDAAKKNAKAAERLKLRGDMFFAVQDVETLSESFIG